MPSENPKKQSRSATRRPRREKPSLPGDKKLGDMIHDLREECGIKSAVTLSKLARFGTDSVGKFEKAEALPNPPDLRDLFEIFSKHNIAYTKLNEVLRHYLSVIRTHMTVSPPPGKRTNQRNLDELSAIVEKRIKPIISPYQGKRRTETTLSLQDHHNLRKGWPMSEITLHHHPSDPFIMPSKYQALYEAYLQRIKKEGWFQEKGDGNKFMVSSNPRTSSDKPHLELHTRPCLYSQALFYRKFIAQEPARRDECIALMENLIERKGLKAHFPHTLCLNSIIVTSDQKILCTRRSPKTDTGETHWLCSADEQLNNEDVKAGPEGAILALGKRLLTEEIAKEITLENDSYDLGGLRVLSVFLEADILNISLLGYIELNLTAEQLGPKIKFPHTAKDTEFIDVDFLDLTEEVLRSELEQPNHVYEETVPYRLYMTYLRNFG